MNFRESENYLLSLGNEVSTMKLGLENIRKLLGALDNPQNNYKKVQVAGTNGKGSVCAFLDTICFRAGIKTALYTSPHLISITERVKIGGQNISETDFAKFATQVRETADKLLEQGEIEIVPTYFEQVTAIALLAFAEAKVELAILETGLGGRLDATTAANAKIVAITPVDYDHQEYLGETLKEIAVEKAEIIRPGSKVVIARQHKETERIIEGRCRELGVDPVWATANIITKNLDDVPSYPIRRLTFTTKNRVYPDIVLGLAGKHQVGNAAVAISLVELLRDEGFKITDDEVWLGLETARHPGRLEYSGQFLFDGVHNAAGAEVLGEYLDEFVHQPITLIFGSMRGKAVGHIAQVLFPRAGRVILTRPENSRAMTPEELAKFIPADVRADRVIHTSTITEALDRARTETPEDGLILVTGSLYLVGEAQKILNNERTTDR